MNQVQANRLPRSTNYGNLASTLAGAAAIASVVLLLAGLGWALHRATGIAVANPRLGTPDSWWWSLQAAFGDGLVVVVIAVAAVLGIAAVLTLLANLGAVILKLISKTPARPTPGVSLCTGWLLVNGQRIAIDFEVPHGATAAEKDSAFLAALRQHLQWDYLVLAEKR